MDTTFLNNVNFDEEALLKIEKLQYMIATMTFTLDPNFEECPKTGSQLFNLTSDIYEEFVHRNGVEMDISYQWIFEALFEMNGILGCCVGDYGSIFYDIDECYETFDGMAEALRDGTIDNHYEIMLEFADDFDLSKDESVDYSVTHILGCNYMDLTYLFCLSSHLVNGFTDDEILFRKPNFVKCKRGKSGNLWVGCPYPKCIDPERYFFDDPWLLLPRALFWVRPRFIVELVKRKLNLDRKEAV